VIPAIKVGRLRRLHSKRGILLAELELVHDDVLRDANIVGALRPTSWARELGVETFRGPPDYSLRHIPDAHSVVKRSDRDSPLDAAKVAWTTYARIPQLGEKFTTSALFEKWLRSNSAPWSEAFDAMLVCLAMEEHQG
jgi:hypothetical protein